jgi:hypothetical protein
MKVEKFTFNSGISPPIELNSEEIKSFDLKEEVPEHEIKWVKTVNGGRFPKPNAMELIYIINIITKDTKFYISLKNPYVKFKYVGGTKINPKELIYTLTKWSECNFDSSKNKV